jgi:hypothetical protein
MIWVIEKPLFIIQDEIILINLIKNVLGVTKENQLMIYSSNRKKVFLINYYMRRVRSFDTTKFLDYLGT